MISNLRNPFGVTDLRDLENDIEHTSPAPHGDYDAWGGSTTVAHTVVWETSVV